MMLHLVNCIKADFLHVEGVYEQKILLFVYLHKVLQKDKTPLRIKQRIRLKATLVSSSSTLNRI